VMQPDLVLLDEPLSQLDPFLRDDLLGFLRDLFAQLDAAVLYVAHDPAEVRAFGSRIVAMERGTLREVSAPHGPDVT
jgi:iron(III) transport system ATP-binding protein